MAVVIRPSLLISVFCLLAGTSLAAFSEKPLTTVADLRYGVALYEYYQDHYLEALSELMIAETRGGIKGHGDNPQLIEGGISLAFGMERKAGAIFERLLNAERPLEVRNAAWFYLGKLRYLRGDWRGAETSLNNIAGEFEQELIAELASLQINLVIQRGDLARAEQLLAVARAQKLDKWLPYLYYNLGAAQSRAQDYEAALKNYTALAKLPLLHAEHVDEEILALNDKALTAAGYSLMLQGRHGEALARFIRVRLDSPLADRALLGYGWAAAGIGDYARALQPWQTLSRRSLLHASAQEALLAVPYAYEKLGAQGEALQAFLNAETVFEQEVARIDAVLASLRGEALLQALEITEASNRNWFSIGDNTEIKPNLSYLTELFASNHFQGAVQELRDLVRMQNQLRLWQEKLDAYQLMLNEREGEREKKLAGMRQRRLLEQAESLTVQRDKLASRIETIAANQDFFAIADGDTASLYDIVRRAEAAVQRLEAAGEVVDEYEPPLKRYRGILLWQASESFPENLWRNRKTLKGLDDALAQLRTNRARLESVIVQAPDINPYRQRLIAMETRVETQLAAIDRSVKLAESALRRQVAESVRQQRLRLQHYLAQTRLSVARLYDAALQERQK